MGNTLIIERNMSEVIMKFWCLFEQSGTFRDVCREFGYKARDYDIANDFGKTDVIIDLFEQIDKAMTGEKSIFDKIKKEDIVFAFFPCIRFTDQAQLISRAALSQYKKKTPIEKIDISLSFTSELEEMYNRFLNLLKIAYIKQIKLIVENPYRKIGWLNLYCPIRPTVIDMDRSLHGDFFKKPTQYWFINISPKNNDVATPEKRSVIYNTKHINRENCKIPRRLMRSMISKEYAKWFIAHYIL